MDIMMEKMNKYEVIVHRINEVLRKLYSEIEDYFENILNAPSTINRIIRYYSVGFQEGKYDSRFILFNNIVIREYEVKLECEYYERIY